ncbi:MAG: DUF3604 domain-containing protein, partial [Parahaliea sp.]
MRHPRTRRHRFLALALAGSLLTGTQNALAAPTEVYFGAVHIHTNYSFDAFTNGTLNTPADAYRWAQGETIRGSARGPDFRTPKALDFYAVSDHAEWMGVFRLMEDPSSPMSKHPLAPRITSEDPNVAMAAFGDVLHNYSKGKYDPSLDNPE